MTGRDDGMLAQTNNAGAARTEQKYREDERMPDDDAEGLVSHRGHAKAVDAGLWSQGLEEHTSTLFPSGKSDQKRWSLHSGAQRSDNWMACRHSGATTR